MSLKDEGNKHYSSDENGEAAAKYSEAIEICPLCYSNERAILFANRAAVHLKNVRYFFQNIKIYKIIIIFVSILFPG